MTSSPHSPTPIRNDGIQRCSWFRHLFSLLAVAALALLGSHHAPAATFTWDGGGGNNNWSTAGNWTVAGVPTQPGTGLDDIQFAGGTRLTPNMQASYNINSLTFNTGAGLFVLGNTGGTTLTLQGGGVTNNDNSLQTVNISAIVLGTSQTWNAGTVAGGSLVFGGATLDLGSSHTLTVDGTNNTSIDNDISGSSSGILKNGTGTLILSGNNSYTGATTVSVGVLNIQHANALGTTAGVTSVTSGAALQIQGGITTAAEALAIDGTGIGATGALRNISGSNTYAGAITINSSTRINSDAGTLTLDVASGDAITGSNDNLTFGGAGNVTVADAITTGSGTLTKDGAGTLILSGNNTYTGATSVSVGVLNIQHANALGATAGSTTVTSGAALQIQGGIITAAEALAIDGTGIGATGALRNISGSNTYAGAITINSSTRINSDAGTLTLDVASGNAITGSNDNLTFGGAGNVTVADVIATGTGTLTKDGAGTLILAGANTFTGATTVSAGALRVANDTGLGTTAGGVSVASGAALELDGSTANLTIGAEALNTLSGTGISNGGALRNISGDNSWAGAITLVDVTGAHRINSDSGTLTIGAGGIGETGGNTKDLTFGGAGNVTVTGNITASAGDMTLVKDGTGTLILGGANTYDGLTTISAGVLRATSSTALGTTGGEVTIASGAALQLAGGIAIGTDDITSLNGTGVGNTGALRNMSGDNSLAGSITLADVAAAKIASDSGTLTLSGALGETGGTVKTLTLGGAGAITFSGTGSSNSVVNITKEGIGSVTTTSTAFNDLTAGTITVRKGTLNLDYGTSVASKLDDTSPLALSGGTVNLQNGGSAHTEVVASTTINAGASNVTQTSGTSVLRMNVITRNAGGTINFGAASIADTDTATTNGILGTWATVGGTAYATTAVAAGANRPIIALAAYGQTVTRLSSGTKVIANTSTNHVQITDGTGGAADITLAAATTAIATLTNNATGGTSTIDPNSQTLRVGGILLPTGSGALNIGNGTNNGTLTAATAGGELVIQNFSTTNNLTVNSVIANFTSASSLTTSGTGTVVLTAANTYTGATNVAGGTLQIGNGGITGSLSTSSTITTNATLAFNQTDTVTQGTEFATVIAGTGGVKQSGSGTLVLNGTNTYTGVTTFDAGVVNVTSLTNYGVAGPLGNRSFSDEAITDIGLYFEGGTLQYTGSTAQSTDRFFRVGLTGGTIDASGSNSGATMSFTNTTPNVDSWADAGSRTITLTGSNTGDNIFAINIQEYNDGSSNTSLVKSGAGTWVLTNPHNSDAQSNSYSTFGGYSGGTTVSGGTLGFVEGAIGGGVIDITGNATLRWEAGNTQDITTGTGAGVARSLRIEDGVTATFNTNGNDVTLSNAIALGGSSTAALTKSGAGTLTLGATNPYTGATTVNGGTLNIGTGGALTATTNVTVNSGGTLLLSGTGANKINDSAAVTLNGGTFSLDGSTSLDEQVGALTLSANSVIDYGTLAAGHILRFADSTGATWGAFTLSVWNWTEGADHLYFGSIFGAGLPVGGLGKILFYYDSGTTPTGGAPAAFGPDNGEVSPVPEPSAVLVGLSLLSLAGYRERRWLFRCRDARRKRTA